MKVFVVQKIKKARKLPLNEWSLGNFIDNSSDIGLLDLEVKKVSHSFRIYRNYNYQY